MLRYAPRIDAPPPPPRLAAGERVYAIGDIHGRLDLFERLVAMIRRDNAARGAARVRLIVLGDLVDRGPGSAELVRRCRAFADRSDRFTVLKGNHEAMMVDAIRGNFPALALWLRSGGDATLTSWGVAETLVSEGPSPALLQAARRTVAADVLGWLDALPLTHRSGSYLFVHAGIRAGVGLADQRPEDLLWIRKEFLESTADHSVVVVHGHSIDARGVTIAPNRIGIDTGAYRTDILTALGLEGDTRWTLATGEDGEWRRSDTYGTMIKTPPQPAAGQIESDLAAILGVDAAAPADPAPRQPPGRASRRPVLMAGAAAATAAVAVAAGLLLDRTPTRPAVATAIAPTRAAPPQRQSGAWIERREVASAERSSPAPAEPVEQATAPSVTAAAARPAPGSARTANPSVRPADRARTPAGQTPAPAASADIGAGPVGDIAPSTPSRDAAEARGTTVASAADVGIGAPSDDRDVVAQSSPAQAGPSRASQQVPDAGNVGKPKKRTRRGFDSIDAIRLLRRQ